MARDLFGNEEKKRSSGVGVSGDAERIWAAYPRKVGKKVAVAAIERALRKGRITYDELLRRVKLFASLVYGVEPQFIPHGSKWFAHDERWNDEALAGETDKAAVETARQKHIQEFVEAARNSPEVAAEAPVVQKWARQVESGVIWHQRGPLACQSATLRGLLVQ